MAIVDQHQGAKSMERDDVVVWLHEEAAVDPAVVGAKAANLAAARSRGLPIVEGFAVAVRDVAAHPEAPSVAAAHEWRELSAGGSVPLVVRSSSTVEDLHGTSMAGVFDSVVDVRGWDAFVDAYRQVVRSAGGGDMAILVQRLLVPDFGGVLFGIDPVSGREDRVVVAAVVGGPHRLVSGEVQGRRTVLTRSGRAVEADGDEGPVLGRRHRHELVELAGRVAQVFGGPQDVEWAIDSGRLVLLQSRPITTVVERGEGPVLGPGPVAETFPHPLTALEIDLWVSPLRAATVETLLVTGSTTRSRVARSPVVTVVDRQVVVDLELTGVVRTGNRALRAVDPRPAVRRLAAAWRVGRLRGAFADLARHVTSGVDAELGSLPALDLLTDDELLRLLDNAAVYLRSLHGHEMLAGALLPSEGGTGAAAALREIARGRAQGWSDEDIIARTPVVLSVLPPSTGPRPALPDVVDVPAERSGELATREELRLRVRWIHELTRQAVRELGARLTVRGLLDDVEEVRHLRLAELAAALEGRPVPRPIAPQDGAAPVPARFRVSAGGAVVTDPGSGTSPGIGAGGGRGTGPVASGDPAPGDVLVVRTLDPGLAPVLGRVAAIVAETGSPLSHLAILAREQGVPVVVGFAGAVDRFPPGTHVVVDGGTGAVELLSEAVAT
jgi:phosphohistidine swiveling domain-containing protein